MEFLKKMFSKKKDESTTQSGGENFTCENCGQSRSISQKKQQTHSEGENKNVCEFC